MFRYLLAILGCAPLCGCVYILGPMWTPPPLKTDIPQARTPEEDVQLLTEMFAGQEARLWSETTRSVRWVETDVFRVYQCDAHYVMVYPPDWTPERYSIMLLPGEMPALPAKGRVFQQSEMAVAVGRSEQAWAVPPGLAGQRAGIESVYLGMSMDELLAAYQDDPDAQGFGDPYAQMEARGYPRPARLTVDWRRRIRPDLSGSDHNYLRAEIHMLNDRVFKIHFNRADARSLQQLQLSSHQAQWVAEGVIELPQ